MFLISIQHSVAAQSRKVPLLIENRNAQSRKVPLLIENRNARLGWARLEAERKARGFMYLFQR